MSRRWPASATRSCATRATRHAPPHPRVQPRQRPRAADDAQLQQVIGEIASWAYAADALRCAPLSRCNGPTRRTSAAMKRPSTMRTSRPRSNPRKASSSCRTSCCARRRACSMRSVRRRPAARRALDRHWRNARTVSSHNPLVYKARIVGDWVINGARRRSSGRSATARCEFKHEHPCRDRSRPMSKTIRFNAFEMNCVGHQSPGLYPSARPVVAIQGSRLLDRPARVLERGIFDAIFIADVIGYYDVWRSNYHALHHTAQIPVNDPLQLAAPIAMATEHLGIGITASTTFEHPYTPARRSTADHHTKGRLAWNIVTSYSKAARKRRRQRPAHARRPPCGRGRIRRGAGQAVRGQLGRRRGRPRSRWPRVHASGARCTRSATAGRFFDVPGYHLCGSCRRSARRCSSRPARPAPARRSPRSTRNACSSPRRRARSSRARATWPTRAQATAAGATRARS